MNGKANWCPKWLFLYFAIWIPHYLLQKSPVFFQISGILNLELHRFSLGFLYAIFAQCSRLAKIYIFTPLTSNFPHRVKGSTQNVFAQRSFFAQREWVKLLSRPKKSYFYFPLELFWPTMTLQKESWTILLYENEKNEREISQWRLLFQISGIWNSELCYTWMLLVANSTPMVDFDSKLNSFRVNRDRRLLLPTPESPIKTTEIQKSKNYTSLRKNR